MSTATLPRNGTFYVSRYMPSRYFKRDNGNMVFEGVPVFRSGVFRDSMGEQNTWEDLHMRQMVENYDYLQSSGQFANVPVRDGHPGWILHGLPGNGRVVGWHTGVAIKKMKSPVDGEEYTYFLADYEITEPDAVGKIERGTWRNRSAEILRYLSNNESEYWPVYGGFAFVDIPAVEGLNFSQQVSPGIKYVMLDEETVVTQPQQGQPISGTAQLLHGSRPLPGGQGNGSSENTPHVFNVNGQAVTDYAAVQQHISMLEQFRNETRSASRNDFIDALAHANVIAATGVDDFKTLAASMNDEQWELWRKGYANVQPTALLSQHAAPAASSATAGSQGGVGGTAADQEIENAKSIVAMHRGMGSMSEEALKKTPSYRKLVAAGIEQA